MVDRITDIALRARAIAHGCALVDLSTAYRCATNLAAKAHFDPSNTTVAEHIELAEWRAYLAANEMTVA